MTTDLIRFTLPAWLLLAMFVRGQTPLTSTVNCYQPVEGGWEI